MIPEGWSVKKLRNVATIKPSGVDKKTNASERPVRLCNYTDVYKNEYIVPDMEFMEATVSESEYNEYRLYKGDIIITKDSEMWNDIAVPSLICQDIRDLVCAYHLCLIRITNDCVTPEFILRLLQAKTYQYQFHIAANGITRFGVSKNTIKDALIAVPPKVTQNHLCDYLLSLCEKIETQIKTINSQIPYIKELQTRLVSDVVTGKLDVREIEVPDFVEELDVFEEDTFDDSMEEVVDAD
jgi:type I restriction enzyme S subunit